MCIKVNIYRKYTVFFPQNKKFKGCGELKQKKNGGKVFTKINKETRQVFEQTNSASLNMATENILHGNQLKN